MKTLRELELLIESILDRQGKLAEIFSHYEWRPEQIRMSKAVAAALLHEVPLLVEAGTGTGKTLAYLIPAIGSGQKVIVSTGTKNLQEQIYFKDIPLLARVISKKFLACNLKGRENYLCRRRWKQFSNYPRRLMSGLDRELIGRMQSWALETRSGDRSEIDFLPDHDPLWEEVNSKRDFCLGQKCDFHSECFINRLRQEANEADIVIVNHHLFFSDLMLKEATNSEVLPRYQSIIFDEAHQIEDIATDYFGLSVSNYQIQELIQDIRREMELEKINVPAINDTLNLLGQRASAFFMHFPPGLEKKRLKSDLISASLVERYQAMADTLGLLTSQLTGLRAKSEPLYNCERRSRNLQDTVRFIMDMADSEYVYWVESRTKAVYLHASPIDVSGDLRRLLFSRLRRLVLTSATLSVDGRFDYLKARLGLESATELVLNSPFDYRRQAVMYVPTHLPDPKEESFIFRAAEEIERIISLSRGRAFILFTSYKNLDQIFHLLQGKLPYQLLRQGDRPKTALLEEFKKDVHSVLLATSSFWEGVDVQGDALSCVIIDRLPFAVPTEPLTEARIDYLREGGGNPFLTYQIPQAIIALRQGIGRLIRSSEDRGLICILDRRLLTKPYGRIFLQNLPDCPICTDLQQVRIF
ncbi:MAG: DEAD/DEAH box helicase [bacterium]|nr:DEAD/DEAH box helicase [bacterium]